MDKLELVLKRIYAKPGYTIGRLYVNDVFFCNTLEDTDRKLNNKMTTDEIRKIKVYGKTAIPTGTYRITMRHKSPKFSRDAFYSEICGGYMPRLLRVPGFDGILIHPGTNAYSTDGCILVGDNLLKGVLCNSRTRWKKLMEHHLLPAKEQDIPIYITICSNYH